jgi:hypothetical protein
MSKLIVKFTAAFIIILSFVMFWFVTLPYINTFDKNAVGDVLLGSCFIIAHILITTSMAYLVFFKDIDED